MSIVRNAAAIAKGMSITLKEVFQPTEVENYPDGKGPMRGAKFRSASAASISFSETSKASRSA